MDVFCCLSDIEFISNYHAVLTKSYLSFVFDFVVLCLEYFLCGILALFLEGLAASGEKGRACQIQHSEDRLVNEV